jgi:hypothetical protein
MKFTHIPVGPSVPLQQVYNQIPFVVQPWWIQGTPPSYTTLRNNRCGRGMLVPVTTTAANTATVIRHNLGRLAQALIPVSVFSTSYPPRITFATGTRTAQQQAIQTDAPVNGLWVWVL